MQSPDVGTITTGVEVRVVAVQKFMHCKATVLFKHGAAHHCLIKHVSHDDPAPLVDRGGAGAG